MVKQSKTYIAEQQSHYLKRVFLWTAVMLVIFFMGIFITGSKSNYFTVAAGVLVMAVALYLSRYIGFKHFKDGHAKWAEIIENEGKDYGIIHSAIMPNEKYSAYFEHIVLTGRAFYFLTYNEKMIQKAHIDLENKLVNKGIDYTQVSFLVLKDEADVIKVMKMIKQNTPTVESAEVEAQIQIINDLLM